MDKKRYRAAFEELRSMDKLENANIPWVTTSRTEVGPVHPQGYSGVDVH